MDYQHLDCLNGGASEVKGLGDERLFPDRNRYTAAGGKYVPVSPSAVLCNGGCTNFSLWRL
jgi:hypothetical protein